MIHISTNNQKGKKIIFKKGEEVVRMHARVNTIFFLQAGELEYCFQDDITGDSIELFSIERTGMIVGWEVLNPTDRYIYSVKIKSDIATLLSIEKEIFISELTTEYLQMICHQLYHLLETSFLQQTGLLSRKVRYKGIDLDEYYISQESTLKERVLLLRSSPFFGEFSETEIISFAKDLERREYDAEDLIYEQDDFTRGLFILIQGEVSIRRQEGESYLDLRSISSPGDVFGWSSTFNHRDICRASAEHKTSVYFISSNQLYDLVQGTSFGISFYKTLIWLVGNQIQLSKSRHIYLLDDKNLISVKHLIDTNRPHIPLPSPLHQIPHLLKDASTQSLAFNTLHQLFKSGTRQERHLSSIALDLLKEEECESKFLNRVAEVYKTVSSGLPDNTHLNRKKCAKLTKKVFDLINYQIEGTENLPKESGNIFIYNHLLNHPNYTLNNRFQFTLDSHFISALILDENYDDPGIRTVRIGKSFEYGHQDYYDNLGYINVFTKESDRKNEKAKTNAKVHFYQEAEQHLKNRKNLIISPEGTSFITEESPGPFKMGPFNLASQMKEEPYLVPIVFCHFDKRIIDSLFFCRILPPFKISEIKKPSQTLKTFVNKYQLSFAKEVANARSYTDLLMQQINQ